MDNEEYTLNLAIQLANVFCALYLLGVVLLFIFAPVLVGLIFSSPAVYSCVHYYVDKRKRKNG